MFLCPSRNSSLLFVRKTMTRVVHPRAGALRPSTPSIPLPERRELALIQNIPFFLGLRRLATFNKRVPHESHLAAPECRGPLKHWAVQKSRHVNKRESTRRIRQDLLAPSPFFALARGHHFGAVRCRLDKSLYLSSFVRTTSEPTTTSQPSLMPNQTHSRPCAQPISSAALVAWLAVSRSTQGATARERDAASRLPRATDGVRKRRLPLTCHPQTEAGEGLNYFPLNTRQNTIGMTLAWLRKTDSMNLSLESDTTAMGTWRGGSS